MLFIDPNLPRDVRMRLALKHIDEFTNLLKHPAFIQLTEYLKTEEERAFSELHRCEKGDMAMKAVGAFTTIKTIRALPEDSIKQMQIYLKQIATE